MNATNHAWMKAHGYSPRFINAVTTHLYGRRLDEALNYLGGAYLGGLAAGKRRGAMRLSEYGNTPYGARKELVRTLNNLDGIADVLIEVLYPDQEQL